MQDVVSGGGRQVSRAVGGGPRGGVVVRGGYLPGAGRPQGRGGQAVPEQLVVGGGYRIEHQLPARCVSAQPVTIESYHAWLVQRYPQRDPVGQPACGETGVLGEPVGGVPGQPAAVVFELLRQVPMEEGWYRRDAAGQQPVGELVVEIKSGRIGRPLAVRLDPGPGDREPVAGHSELGHQLDVLRPAVIMIIRDVTGVAVPDGAGLPAEHVPDRVTAAVFGYRAFDLIGGSRDAPRETGREGRHGKIAHQMIVCRPDAAKIPA